MLSKWKNWIALGAVVAALVAFRAFFGLWKIPQRGMVPSYDAGALLLCRKRPYGAPDEVKRGDVVVFRERRPGGEYHFIWRVVGLPGEKIAIRDDAVIVNGRAIARGFVRDQGDLKIFREQAEAASYEVAFPSRPSTEQRAFAPVEVPAGHFFLLGDNRHAAHDSRATGPVPFEAIIARAAYRFPINQ
jgi:signal peptidase I